MPEVLDLLLSWIATTAACFYVVMRDERRLQTAEERRRAGDRSHDGVILALGQPIVWGGLCYLVLAILLAPQDEELLRAPWLAAPIAAALQASVSAYFVARRDARRVTPDLLERAWPAVSRAAAIVAFGQVAVWVHFWKTRRYGFRGFFLGFFWMVALTMPALAVGFVLDLIFPDSR